ncbi:hypothetical protein AM587_10012073 [Phytophthora nicotianae]|uniref:Uncharacterized protein n=1 Tax=Phytophthora nicotianae TaxID=4792 RepID=A0A0W8DWW1_PHYNI|nr:hypothetical protein AM587_10012073 [Phytophthora nicotianae]
MDAQSGAPLDEQLRQQYDALLAGDPITADYERWRELKRLVIVHGLPRDEGFATDIEGSNASLCSLRGRVWKAFLGVENDVDMTKYAALVGRGASHYDGDIRNDTFRTFRGDLEFAQRVPEEKLVRLLNVFINELGSSPGEEKQEDGDNARNGNLPSIRDMDLMKVLSLRCAPPLQSDLLISVALQLLHRLPEDLLYEIARHPFENPDAPTSLPFHPKTISAIATQVRKQQEQQTSPVRTPRSSSRGQTAKDKPVAKPGTPRQTSCSSSSTGSGRARPPWKI